MSGITFSIQNPNSVPANQAYLYLEQENTLNFVFSNTLGIKQLGPGDSFRLVIPSNLLVSVDAGQLNSPDWTIQVSQPSSGNANYTLLLSPAKPIDFSSPLLICLKQLHSPATTIADVSTSYKIGGRPMSGSSIKLSVLNPPNQPLDLNDAISFEVLINDDQTKVDTKFLYVSSENLQPPIANRIHLNLKYGGQQLVPSWKTQKTPKFTFTFAYGSDANALTNALKSGSTGYNALTSAWNIAAAVGASENNLWTLEPPNTAADTPAWVIVPTVDNQNLFTGNQPNLDLLFSHVISVLPPGNPTVYIQWNNIPGYNDGVRALDIETIQPEPLILDFYSADDGKIIPPEQSVVVNWTVFNAGTLNLSWDYGQQTRNVPAFDSNNPQLYYTGSDDSIIPDSPKTEIYLSANNNVATQKGPISVTTSPFPQPIIAQFSGESCRDKNGNIQVQLSWLVKDLGNSGSFILNGVKIDGTGYNGKLYTTYIPFNEAVFSKQFTLQALDTENNTDASKTITVPISKISAFAAVLNRDAAGNSTLVLNWEVINLLPNTNYTLNGAPCTIDAQGKGGISIALSESSTLKLSYALEMVCPGQPPISKVLNSNFKVKSILGNSPEGDFYPRSPVISQDGKFCIVLYTQTTLRAKAQPFYLGWLDTLKADNLKISAKYPNPEGYSIDSAASLTLSPDNKQVMIGGSQLLCALLNGSDFDPQLRMPSNVEGKRFFSSYYSAFLSDMSAVFMALSGQIFYRKADVTQYALYSATPNNPDLSEIYGFWPCDFWKLELSADSTKMFAADFGRGKLWWFDPHNPPDYLSDGMGLTLTLSDMVLAGNNWMYLIYADNGSGKSVVFTFDIGSNNYGIEYCGLLGTSAGPMYSAVSKDCSLLVVSDFGSNQVFLTTGATKETPQVKLLQTISIDMPGKMAISHDNTRIFLAAVNGVVILEPIFE